MPLNSSALELERSETDVLVIGGGGAGLAACISAAEAGAKVVVASKTRAAGPSCTYHNAGWITYATPDSADELFYQVVDAGGYLNDQRLVEVFAKETARLPERLTSYGVRLDLPDDEETEGGTFPALMTITAAKGRPRGAGLTEPMRKRAEKLGVTFLDGVSLGELVVDDGRVVGAVLLDHAEAKLVAVSARATVLASGGGAAAFARTDNPTGITGDGFTAAFRAGAELINLECVSFSLRRPSCGTRPADATGDLTILSRTTAVGSRIPSSRPGRSLSLRRSVMSPLLARWSRRTRASDRAAFHISRGSARRSSPGPKPALYPHFLIPVLDAESVGQF